MRAIWNILFLAILSLPNLVGLWFDPTSTKFAALIVPIILFVGLSRLVSTHQWRFFLGLPLIILSFVSLNILIQFNSQITEGVIDAIINSDSAEAWEFMKETRASVYWLLLLYVITSVFLFVKGRSLDQAYPKAQSKKIWLTLLLILLPVIDTIGKGASGRSYPLIIARTTYIYTVERAAMEKLLKLRENFRFNASIKDKSKKETYIFVIGETSRRDFYSLYGYYRDTNPKLGKLDGLAVFKDAISPANATVPSLKAILHLSTADDDSQFFHTKSIVSLAKEVGYKTWWLSAQSRYGKHETSVSSSGVDSDVKQYIEEGRTLSRTYDNALIPLLEESLSDTSPQKFIVMHLYGSHISYHRRYPELYSKFIDTPQGYENHPEQIQRRVNHYANSIAYTDSVLAEVIKKTESKNESACMVYIADHGEYIADNLADSFIGHGGALPYKVEVEIPLIVWCSKQYREDNPEKWKAISENQDKPINIEDMFYSLSDLMRINYALMQPKRSFFNKYFLPMLPRKTRSSSTGKVFDYKDLK